LSLSGRNFNSRTRHRDSSPGAAGGRPLDSPF
jgi:hypothetical protein